MDITEIALGVVTDDFIAYIKALEGSEEGWDLNQTTEFFVVAATLLDLKAARLLPSGEIEDEGDLALLEAGIYSLLDSYNIGLSKRLRQYFQGELS
jgi:segregation and condensation protein A